LENIGCQKSKKERGVVLYDELMAPGCCAELINTQLVISHNLGYTGRISEKNR
jgi:hypothetical protein